MENLEHVVRERNRAYYELETAESGKFFFTFLLDIVRDHLFHF
jgi:hypothetical protein